MNKPITPNVPRPTVDRVGTHYQPEVGAGADMDREAFIPAVDQRVGRGPGRQLSKREKMGVRASGLVFAGFATIIGGTQTAEHFSGVHHSIQNEAQNPFSGGMKVDLDNNKVTIEDLRLSKVDKALDPARSEHKLNEFNFMEKLSTHKNTEGKDTLFEGFDYWVNGLKANPGELASVITTLADDEILPANERPKSVDDVDAINALSDRLVLDNGLHDRLSEKVDKALRDKEKTKLVRSDELVAGKDQYTTFQISPVAKDSDNYGKISRTVVTESGTVYYLTYKNGEEIMVCDNCGQFGDNVTEIPEEVIVQRAVPVQQAQVKPQYLVAPQTFAEEAPVEEVAPPPPPAPAAPAPVPPSTWTITLPNIPTINIPLPPNISIPPVVITPPPAVDIPRLDFKAPQQGVLQDPSYPVPMGNGGELNSPGKYQPPETVYTPPTRYEPPASIAPSAPAPNSSPSGLFGGGQAPAAPGLNGTSPGGVLSGLVDEKN